MPITLPPTRRRFLAASVAAGLLPKWGFATPDADRWVLIADSHVAADRRHVERGVNMADNLGRVVREIIEASPKPAGVILNGDAAFRSGEVADYGTLGDLLAPLRSAGLPVHVTLGNHDDRDKVRRGLNVGLSRSPLREKQVAVIEGKRCNWFLLDTLDQVNATPGAIGGEQREWLARELDARPKLPALVVMHHNPDWLQALKPTGVADTRDLFALLTPRKQVKAVIFGHTHQWTHATAEGIHLVNLPPTAYLFNNSAPNGWTEWRVRDGGAEVRLHTLDAKHAQAGDKLELEWR